MAGNVYQGEVVNPHERLAKLGEAAAKLVGGLAYQVGTIYPVVKINQQGRPLSRITDYAGYLAGTQNMRYLYFEVDSEGNSHFLGGANDDIKDIKKIVFNPDGRYLQEPQLSDFTNTTQAIDSLTHGLFGDPKYDALFNRFRNSIVAEQIKLYQLYGVKDTIGDIGGDGPKHRIVRVDRYNLANMGISGFYLYYREKLLGGISPIARSLEGMLSGEGVTTVPFMRDVIDLWTSGDEAATGIGYYPGGPKEFMERSPTYSQIEELTRQSRELELLFRGAIAAQSPQGMKSLQDEIRKIGKKREDLIAGMGNHKDELLFH